MVVQTWNSGGGYGQSRSKVCSPGRPAESGLVGKTPWFQEERAWRREASAQPCLEGKVGDPEVPRTDYKQHPKDKFLQL